MEQELKERLERLGGQILVSSRNEIYLSMRFFESAFHRLSYQMLLSTQSLGTDGEKLYYNPKHLLELYDKSPVTVNRAYLHVLLHCLFRHLFKEEFMQSEGGYDTNWDLACDIVVESVMDSFEEITCVLANPSSYREDIYEKLKSRLPVLTAEGIFHELKTMAASQREYERLRKEFCVDDHSFWRNQKRPPEQKKQPVPGKERKQLEALWEETSRKTQTAMETFYRQAGDRAGNLRIVLKIQNRCRDDYRQFLRRFAVRKEEMKLDLDSFDYIPYCFGIGGYGKGREYHVPLIEPLEYRERQGIDEFAVAVDTSGSLSKNQIEEFLAETMDVLQSEETFFRKVKIYVFLCDAILQRELMITSREELRELTDHIEVSGFGGTDFRPVFSRLEQLSEDGTFTKLRGLLYFTDGFGIYPEYIPSFETAFILPADRIEEPTVPVWATRVSAEFLGKISR